MAMRLRRHGEFEGAPDIRPLVWILAASAAVELAMQRTFTRTAIHIPDIEALRTPYEVLTRGGEFAYFLTLCLLLPAGVAAVVALYRSGHPQWRLATFALLVFAVAWPLVDLGMVSSGALDVMTVASVLGLGAVILLASPARQALPIGSFAMAYAASAFFTLAATGDRELSPGQQRALLNTAEVAAVAFACTVPLLVSGARDRFAVTVGVVTGLLVFGALLGNGATSRFLLLWNIGLSGSMPSFFYAASAGGLMYTILRAMRGGYPLVAAGLVLLVAGGIGLHSTYQSALVVVGLAAMASGLRAPCPRTEPAAAPLPAAVAAIPATR